MKRFVLIGMISTISLAACNLLPETKENDGFLSFEMYNYGIDSYCTKADAIDTNSFILKVINSSGEEMYNDKYGNRPEELIVSPGTYEISVVSQLFDAPAFDKPQFGDSKTVVVSSGESVHIAFLCVRTNCGVKVNFSDQFRQKYNGGNLLISQESGELNYLYDETRTAYLFPESALFYYSESNDRKILFSRELSVGKMLVINLDASSNTVNSNITVAVDTTAEWISETIVVGENDPQDSRGDGSTLEKACSVASAKNRTGDTIWVSGYIAGGDLSSSSISFEIPFTKNTCLAIASSSDEKERSNCMSVELPSGTVREALNLVDNPGNLGKRVAVYGIIDPSYYGLVGVKKVTNHSFL